MERATLMSAFVLENEGLDFYSKVSKVAADPRARHLFQVMAERRSEDVRLLRHEYKELTGEGDAPSPDEAERRLAEKGQQVPSIYPKTSLETAVCFVCGEEVPVDALPNECPTCGASRYTFERDIDEKMARRMAQDSEMKRLEFYEESLEVATGRVRDLLEDLVNRTKVYLRDLEVKQP
ncbi:MAG: hypothetical protein ACE5HJ_03395 [Thermoplasmata archaeon]